MDGNDHCAVFGCSNSRNKPERLVAQFFVLFFKLLLTSINQNKYISLPNKKQIQ